MAKGWARLQADQGKQPSYAYFFSRQLPGDEKGAWHSADLWYAFGTLDSCWPAFHGMGPGFVRSDGVVPDDFAKTATPTAGIGGMAACEKGPDAGAAVWRQGYHHGGVSVARLTHTMLTKPNVGE